MAEVILGNSTTHSAEWLEIVRQKVEALRYGEVQIIVHDQRVTQIDSTEKTRLPATHREG